MPNPPPTISARRPRLAVHKLSSCDGCQLSLLNAGEGLLALVTLADIVHFAEAGMVDPEAQADIALVEGSVSTPEEWQRIRRIRDHSRYLIPIGACATAGGPQGLRNLTELGADASAWIGGVYPQPAHIDALPTATRVADHVRVDLELRGCPVTTRQVLGAVRSLLLGAPPPREDEAVCAECKRQGITCVLVARGLPCLGPVTATGCGALCPGLGRDCYGCYGPAENPNPDSLTGWLAEDHSERRGLTPSELRRRFLYQNAAAPAFRAEAGRWREDQQP